MELAIAVHVRGDGYPPPAFTWRSPSTTVGSPFGYPDAIVRFGLKHVKVNLRLAAEELLQISDNIRIVDRGKQVVPGLHVVNGLVKFEDIHRPGKVLKMDLKMPGHDA
jgi:hypothetical protein